MSDGAGPADEGEQRKAHWHDMADKLVGEEHREFPYHERVELAFAVPARPEA